MHRLGLVTLLASFSLLAFGAARTAHANGRFPAAQHVLVGPGTSDPTIALRATFGFLVSDDAGASFRYLCEDALGYGAQGFYDPPFALDASRRIHVGLTDGQSVISSDRCAFGRDDAFEGAQVMDLDHSADGTRLVAAVRTTDAHSWVFRSEDGGTSWQRVGSGVAGVTMQTLEMAPSNPMRIYFTANDDATQRVLFYRSDDGGVTLTLLPLPFADSSEDAYVSGVDPHAPDTVYVRARLLATLDVDGGGTAHPTVLLRSTDGGTTWTELSRSHGQMLGFAVSDAGAIFWGGPNALDGLQRSTDGGRSFARVAGTQVQCLRWHAGALYVCGNDGSDGFALARSTDEGTSLVPLLRFRDVQGVFACPSASIETGTCAGRWNTIARQYFAASEPPALGDAGSSDAMDAPADSRSGTDVLHSCHCRIGPVRSNWMALWFAIVACFALRRRDVTIPG